METVPYQGVLVILVTFTVLTSNQLEEQFWYSDISFPQAVRSNSSWLEDCFTSSDNQSTVTKLSCFPGKMSGLTTEQKAVIKSLYKFGRKIIHSESHIQFLKKSIESDFIPKNFRLKNTLPGNQIANEERIQNVCKDAIIDEQANHK